MTALYEAIKDLAKNGYIDDAAKPYLAGFKDLPIEEQRSIVRDLAKNGYFDDSAQPILAEAMKADSAEVGTAAELPAAEMTAQDLEKPKATPKEVPKAEPETFGDMIANSTALRALFPRTYARLDQGETGILGAGIAGALDLPSSIGRGAVALGKLATGNLGERTGENFAKEMGKIEKAPETRGIGGFAEAVARDPLTALTFGGAGIGRAAAARLIPEATTALQKVAQAGIAGAATGGVPAAGVSLGQLAIGEKTPEQAAMQTGLGAAGGAVIGSGLQALGNILRPKTAPVVDGVVRPDLVGQGLNPEKYDEEIVKSVARELGISEAEAKTIPDYMQGVATNMTPELRQKMGEFLRQAMTEKRAVGLEQKLTPKMIVSQRWGEGLKAMDQTRSALGKEMGDIEAQALNGEKLSIAPVLARANEAMGKYLGLTIVPDGNGAYYVRALESGSKTAPKNISGADEIVGILTRHGEEVTGEQLRNIERSIRSTLSELSTTRYDRGATPYDATAEDIYRAVGGEVRGMIGERGGQEMADAYARARKDYAEIMKSKDYLERRLGQKAEGDFEVDGLSVDFEGSARGANLVERLITGIGDNNTNLLARKIKEITGEDLYKEAALAKYAEEMAKSVKSGRKSESLKPAGVAMEALKRVVGKGKPKQAADAFESIAIGTGKRAGEKAASRVALAGSAVQDPNARLRGSNITLEQMQQRALLNSRKK